MKSNLSNSIYNNKAKFIDSKNREYFKDIIEIEVYDEENKKHILGDLLEESNNVVKQFPDVLATIEKIDKLSGSNKNEIDNIKLFLKKSFEQLNSINLKQSEIIEVLDKKMNIVIDRLYQVEEEIKKNILK